MCCMFHCERINAFIGYIVDSGSNALHVKIARTSQFYEVVLSFPSCRCIRHVLPPKHIDNNARALDLGSLVLEKGHT